MKTKSLFFMLALSFLSVSLHADDALKESLADSLTWLKIVDQEKYVESWEKGSLTLKLRIPKKIWVQLMDATRKPLGSVKSRVVADQRTAQDPEGLPKGDYMVLVYNTSFDENQDGHELVTLVQESDGTWRVLTYQVK